MHEGLVLADEAALKSTWSSKGAAGIRPCFICKNIVCKSMLQDSRSEYLRDISEADDNVFDLYSTEEIWNLFDLLEQKSGL